MKENLIDLICCPVCNQALSISEPIYFSDEIWEGKLTCRQNHLFPIHNGMPHLFIDDDRWRQKAKEAAGWVKIHKELGIYEPVENPVDFKIPFFDEEPWISVAKSFDVALTELRLTGNEVVLDLGAGRGWASKEFAKLGNQVVALDITSDEKVGLGRAHAIMGHHDVYFDCVIGDGEKLPFFADKFDLVFCSATLHHSSDLPLLLANIEKVLKKRGQLCAIFEPCISVGASEDFTLARDAQRELDLGINETRPNLFKYVNAAQNNGLRVCKAYPMPAFGMSDDQLRRWGKDVGALFPVISARRPLKTLSRLRHYFGPRWTAWRNGDFGKIQQMLQNFEGRRHVEASILCWIGDELFLIVAKP